MPTLRLELPDGVAVSSAGDDCIDIARTAGMVLDPWQCDELRAACAERADGKWAAFEVGEVVPRQNGKNGILVARQLAGLFLFNEPDAVHTAHQMKTTKAHLEVLKTLIESTPALDKRVKIIRTGEAEQAIELLNGNKLSFIARSGRSGRGLNGTTVYLDEALYLDAQHVGALLPLMRTKPNPQVWYTSSAPKFESTFLHGLLRRAETPSIDELELYLSEWASPADVRYDDEDAWFRCNPTLGIRVSVQQMAREWRTLRGSPEGIAEFARECLGIREGGDSQPGVVDYAVWESLKDPPNPAARHRGSHIAGARAVGLAVSPDGAASSFSVFGVREDGEFHIGTIDRRGGTGWVVERAKDLYDELDLPLYVATADPASALLDQLEREGVPVETVTEMDYARACFNVLEWIKARRIRHGHQETLNRSVAAAGKRNVGRDLWVWARPGAVDITPLVAGTYAAAGLLDGVGDADYWNGED